MTGRRDLLRISEKGILQCQFIKFKSARQGSRAGMSFEIFDYQYSIKFVLPDSVADFHVDLPDRSPVKRKMTRHWEWGITCYLLVTTSMTETFDVLPDQGPVNF